MRTMGYEVLRSPVDRHGRAFPEPPADLPQEVIICQSLGCSECVLGVQFICHFLHLSVHVSGALSATTTLLVATTGYADTFG